MSNSLQHFWGTLQTLPHNGEPPAIKFIPNIREMKAICWLPSDQLRGDLAEHAAPKFLIIERPGADAAIAPLDNPSDKRDPLHNFFHLAWYYGSEIRKRGDPEAWNQDVVDSYSVMWFLYRRFHRTKAYSSRRFNTNKDFRNGRGEPVFPWTTDAPGIAREYPTSIEELLILGDVRARQLALLGPTHAQQLHYGLSAAARIQSLECNGTKAISNLVSTSLLARENPTELCPIAREKIEAAVIAAVLRSAKSDRDMEEFDAWLLGKSNSYVKQLSQSLGSSIGDAYCNVRQYLDESGIRAMKYLSGCIQALMRDVERCLVASGISFDRKLFAMLYYPQTYFDDLPLILLREKLEFFEGTIESLRSDDENAVSEFHTMLWFYAQLVEERRRVDRERSPSRRSRRSGLEFDMLAPSIVRDGCDMDLVIEKLVDAGQLDCPCDPPQWICLDPQSIPMPFRCDNCQSEVRLGDSQES